MAEALAGKKTKWVLAFGVVALATVAAVFLVAAVASRAKVTGSTARERIASVCQLADQRPMGAAEALVEVAVGDPDPSVRQAALVGLGSFIGPKQRPAVEAGTRDPDASVRSSAAMTLGLYNDEAAANRLGELVAGDSQESVRLAAVGGLGREAHPRALVLLAEAMEKNDNPTVQGRAFIVLIGRFKLRFAGTPDPKDKARWGELTATVRGHPLVRDAYKRFSGPGGGGG